MEFLYKEEGYKILGACFEVYNEIGPGFLEAIYQECLELEFSSQGIDHKSQHELQIQYKGNQLQKSYIPDFIIYDKIILEIKAVKKLTDEHRAQTFNYLKATGLQVAYLINFASFPKLEYERIVYSSTSV